MKGRVVAIGTLVLLVVMNAGVAFATPTTPATVVSGAAEDVQVSLFDIFVAVLPYVAILAAVTIGIRKAMGLLRRA
ncbi:MAG TPA: hypothetical protein VGA20_09405 [Gemmatimonadales bacterium]